MWLFEDCASVYWTLRHTYRYIMYIYVCHISHIPPQLCNGIFSRYHYSWRFFVAILVFIETEFILKNWNFLRDTCIWKLNCAITFETSPVEPKKKNRSHILKLKRESHCRMTNIKYSTKSIVLICDGWEKPGIHRCVIERYNFAEEMRAV